MTEAKFLVSKSMCSVLAGSVSTHPAECGSRQRAVVCPLLLSPIFGAAVPLPPLLSPRAAWQPFSGSAFLAHMAEPKPHHCPHEFSHICCLCQGLAGSGGVLATLRPLSLVAKP